MALKMTNAEFDAYCNQGGRTVSDMDMGYNRETKEFDRPAVEWDDLYGTHWSYYTNEEARQIALRANDAVMDKWLVGYRAEQAKVLADKRAESQRIASLKTLGGQFPQLKKLLEKVA